MGKFLLIFFGGFIAIFVILFLMGYLGGTGIVAILELPDKRKKRAEAQKKYEEERRLEEKKNFVRSQVFYKQISKSIFDFVSESLDKATYLYENESPYSWPSMIYIVLHRDKLEMKCRGQSYYDNIITPINRDMGSFGFNTYEFECFYYEYERMFKLALVEDLNKKFALYFREEYGTIEANF